MYSQRMGLENMCILLAWPCLLLFSAPPDPPHLMITVIEINYEFQHKNNIC